MSRLRVLLYKEWRDQRALVVGALLLCVLLVVIAKLVIGPRFNAELRTQSVLPACLGLLAIALATDSIARDACNGVGRTLDLIPARRTLAWISKCLFVALASLGGLVVLALLEMSLRRIEHRPALDGLLAMYQPIGWLLIAATAAACFASACVVRRSLPAALLGIVLVFAVPLLAYALPVGRATEWIDLILGSSTPTAFFALVGCAFVIGSLLAFRTRGIEAFGLRRAARAAAGVGLVLVPVVAGSARKSAWAFDIVPFSKPVEIRSVIPSPDGRFIALQVSQAWTPRSNWLALTGSRTSSGCRVRFETWILDRTTGALKEIDDRFRACPMDRPWDADGHLVTVSVSGAFGDGEYSAERIDPLSGTVLSSHPETEQDSVFYRKARGDWCKQDVQGTELVLSWKEKGIELRLARDMFVFAAPQPGVVFHEQDGFLVRHELEPDSTTRLVELRHGENTWLRLSPDGRYLQLFSAREPLLLDAHDGRVLQRFDRRTGLAEWSQVHGRICLCRRDRDEWFALQEDGSRTTLPVHSDRCQELDPEHLLAIDGQRVECVKLDGSERVTLYEARP